MTRALATVGLALLAGCQMESVTCSSVPSIVGTWRYSAVRETPVHATIAGTLSISSATCQAIAGSMDIVETTAGIGAQRFAGPISGQVIGAESFQFDAYLGGTPWQHLASVKGDSLSGNWVSSGARQTEAGSFGGRRQ